MCIWWHTRYNQKNINWIHSVCAISIALIYLNVIVAIGTDNFTTNNSSQQPCDRTRRVLTDVQGEISDGPAGFNYTQVSFLYICIFWNILICLLLIRIRINIILCLFHLHFILNCLA